MTLHVRRYGQGGQGVLLDYWLSVEIYVQFLQPPPALRIDWHSPSRDFLPSFFISMTKTKVEKW